MQFLHILQGHACGTHFLINFLKLFNETASLNLFHLFDWKVLYLVFISFLQGNTLFSQENQFSFYQGFLSQTLAISRTAEKGKEPSFILQYRFYMLTNVQTFSCNFACEMIFLIFLIASLKFTRLLFDEIYHLITIWLINDAMIIFVCLLDDLILGFCYGNLTWETGEFEHTSTITLVLQVNQLTKCASHLFLLNHCLQTNENAIFTGAPLGIMMKINTLFLRPKTSLFRNDVSLWKYRFGQVV